MLFVSTTVMTDEIRTMLDNYRSAAKEQARLAGFTRSPDGLRMTMFGQDGDGNRKLWDLAYEPEGRCCVRCHRTRQPGDRPPALARPTPVPVGRSMRLMPSPQAGERSRPPLHHAAWWPCARIRLAVFVLHATKKLITRVGTPSPGPGARSTTVLGDWYATVLFWRPQVALFVNESTLLPVLMPLAPAGTVTARFSRELSLLLAAHQVSHRFIDAEFAEMHDCRLTTTSNRRVQERTAGKAGGGCAGPGGGRLRVLTAW